MDTLEYQAHLMRVGKDMMRAAEGAWKVAEKKITGSDREAAIDVARTKLAEYDAVDAQLAGDSPVLQAQFAKRFKRDVNLIRDSLARIDAEARPGNEP
jgi:hypothetical protein